MTEPVGEATQVVHPLRAAWRTFIQSFLPSFLMLVLVLPEVLQIVIDEMGEVLPVSLRTWLAAFSLFISAAAAAIARIMAIKNVNERLRSVRMSATP